MEFTLPGSYKIPLPGHPIVSETQIVWAHAVEKAVGELSGAWVTLLSSMMGYLLSSMERIWPATFGSVTSAYLMVALMSSMPVQGLISPWGS
jgi:hypothetical protein